MGYIAPLFKAVSMIFSFASIVISVRAIIDPAGFSSEFGLPLVASQTTRNTTRAPNQEQFGLFYASLMNVRQLGTAVILLVFAYQGKWHEVATILAIIGVLVAGTDAIFLMKAGKLNHALTHAIPGSAIAALAVAASYMDDF